MEHFLFNHDTCYLVLINFTRKLINNGFSMDEIYGMVKMKAFNEVENTYVTFYKT